MTDTDNLTEQESDDLLRQEIFAQEDSNSDSGTNESQEQEVNENESHNEDVDTSTETSEEESQAEQETEKAEEKPKKKSNVAKILSEKNEYKRNWLEAQERIKELESSL
jgi:outer membrane biosynthesis protein TonB